MVLRAVRWYSSHAAVPPATVLVLPAQLSQSPGTRQPPVAHNCVRRDLHYGGRFFDAQTAEKAQFDHSGFTGIDLRQGTRPSSPAQEGESCDFCTKLRR